MVEMDRISVSLPTKLLEEFDKVISERGYACRSEAIRDAIRDYIIKHKWIRSLEGERIGNISIIYNHNSPELMKKLTTIQHTYTDLIIATLHMHLDHDHCMEVILVRGDANKIKELTDKLASQKGVKYVKLTVMAPGGKIPE
ncbi:MAG TPA: nickel-responsive transcriptional regulator NikR [Methanothermococcus okinawensis]|uniref:Putative nickel-responsive regulator n=1 Tax=Methanofervidicoccus abyssi TaxID=2082189 RepID=A0A401HRM0_9EURY|nr:nickel-responsive transcriptional regulator NikR [Methanofervidicoccus abyssi]GBF36917.1 CopG family transcriptional regulator, nickel-responsive regulator [Methanofervidicoccus abyssi]HIP16582.1 nickel-responsive transcriptional regulator NikR [Methanothermococcus okinawensis]HIP34476.1 nickel-responsive transcriptional regulator NikR [Methanothermococcus okinawensis]